MEGNGSSALDYGTDNESQHYDDGYDQKSSATHPVHGLDGQSHEQKVFMFVTQGVLVTAVGLLGLAGNAVSIAVLSRPQMRSSINCCLIGLATFDLLVLASSIIMFGLRSLCIYTGLVPVYLRLIFPSVAPVAYPVGMIAQTGSVWVTVTVTAERYVAVCLPLRAKSLCTYGRAKGYMVAITLFSLVYNLPRFWEVERQVAFDDRSNSTFLVVQPSALRENERYVHIYINWLYLLVLYVVPFAALAFLNARIWAKVRDANKERQKLSRLQRKEMGLAIMLLCVVVVFFVCNLLALLVNVLEVAEIIVDELTAASNLLVTVNSSVNFVIYCIFGQKFRRVLVRTYCRPCCRPLNRSDTTDSVVVGAGNCGPRGRGPRPVDDPTGESTTDYVMLNVSTNRATYHRRESSANGAAVHQCAGSRRRTWVHGENVDDDETSTMVVPSTPQKSKKITMMMVRRAGTWPWSRTCARHDQNDL